MEFRFQALAELPSHAIVDLNELARLIGCHVMTVKRNERDGTLPPSFKGLSGKRSWRVEDIFLHFRKRAEKVQFERERIERLKARE